MDIMMSKADFAADRDVSERTVTRWITSGQLPAAVKVRGEWQIPASAVRVLPPARDDVDEPGTVTDLSVTRDNVTRPGHDTDVPMSAALELQPAYLELDVAARLLGVPASTIRRHRDEFGAVRRGARGALVVPQRVVREAAGL